MAYPRLHQEEWQAFEMLSKRPIRLRGQLSKGKGKGISGALKARMAHDEGGKVLHQIPFPFHFERLPRRLNVHMQISIFERRGVGGK